MYTQILVPHQSKLYCYSTIGYTVDVASLVIEFLAQAGSSGPFHCPLGGLAYHASSRINVLQMYIVDIEGPVLGIGVAGGTW